MSLAELFKDRKGFTERYMKEFSAYGEGCYPTWVYEEFIKDEEFETFRGYESEAIELTVCCQEFRHGMEMMQYFNHYDPNIISIWIDQYMDEEFDQELFDFYTRYISDDRLIEEYNYICQGRIEVSSEYKKAFDKLFSEMNNWY